MDRAFLFALLSILPFSLTAQEVQVSGTVRALNNAPVAGASVILKGTPMGTVTDMDGNFTVVVPEGRVVLLFSFLKRKPVEHPIVVRGDCEYQVNAILANRSQTFNNSKVVSAEFPEDAPQITGRVVDETGQPIPGVRVVRRKGDFWTFTHSDGSFELPLSGEDYTISFRLQAFRPLDYDVDVKTMTKHRMEVILVADRFANGTLESLVKFFGPADENTP